jgi:hypothetical protein
MFCKHAEGNKINQEMEKNNLMLRCGKGEEIRRPSSEVQGCCIRTCRQCRRKLEIFA